MAKSKIKFKAHEVIDALIKSYKNISKKKPVYGYEGPLLSPSCFLLATSYNIDEKFSKENIEFNKEKGISNLETLVEAAFQLGIEQGMNIIADDIYRLPVEGWDEEDWKKLKYQFGILCASNTPDFLGKLE